MYPFLVYCALGVDIRECTWCELGNRPPFGLRPPRLLPGTTPVVTCEYQALFPGVSVFSVETGKQL